jgi:hypothetical protein
MFYWSFEAWFQIEFQTWICLRKMPVKWFLRHRNVERTQATPLPRQVICVWGTLYAFRSISWMDFRSCHLQSLRHPAHTYSKTEQEFQWENVWWWHLWAWAQLNVSKPLSLIGILRPRREDIPLGEVYMRLLQWMLKAIKRRMLQREWYRTEQSPHLAWWRVYRNGEVLTCHARINQL